MSSAGERLRDEVVRLGRLGVPPAEIERRIAGAMQRGNIYAVLVRARRRGIVIPHFSTSGACRARRPSEAHQRTVLVPVDIIERLAPAAAARGISTNELIRRLLDAIADDGLANSVLDDQPEHAA